MKKILSIIAITLILVVGVITPAYAALPENNTVEPMWESISYLSSTIGFSGSNGNATGVCTRKNGVEWLSGTMTVYKNVNGSWVYVDEMSKSVSEGSLAISVDFPCESGVEYMSEFTVTAFENGVPELASKTTYKTCANLRTRRKEIRK